MSMHINLRSAAPHRLWGEANTHTHTHIHTESDTHKYTQTFTFTHKQTSALKSTRPPSSLSLFDFRVGLI